MHLIEVLMAGSVFAIASGSSMQLWSATAVRAHQLSTREQLEQQIEQDRLQLQTLWRNSLQAQGQTATPTSQVAPDGSQAIAAAPDTGCTATAPQLLTLAASQPAQPSLHREIQLSSNGKALQIQWRAIGDPHIRRDRMVTPAGLGLCGLPPAESAARTPSEAQARSDTPLTDSQMEGVLS